MNEPMKCVQCGGPECNAVFCKFTGLQHSKREVVEQPTPRDLLGEIADASQAFEISDVSPHARVLNLAEPEHLYDDGTDYWREKAKERREEFAEEDAMNRKRAYPDREPR